MTEAGQQGGAFGAVLRPVIDDMGEAVPEDAITDLVPLIADGRAQVFIAQPLAR